LEIGLSLVCKIDMNEAKQAGLGTREIEGRLRGRRSDWPHLQMSLFTRRLLFFLFLLSGFCSLLYQVIWTRMAFASFGVISPVLSVVLSVFMLGLSLGAWAGGRWIDLWVKRTGASAIFFYGLTELMIGIGAFAVPKSFALGAQALISSGETDSFRYLLFSALVLGTSILPWCVCMGATFPLMMAYVREREQRNVESFSFLYLANVLGAMSGTLVTAIVLVEVFGFKHTLWIAAAGNFTIAAISGCLGWMRGNSAARASSQSKSATKRSAKSPPSPRRRRLIKWILFSTGFIALAMEVIWVRAFTPVLKTQVYAFAMIVFSYLGATFLGSWFYRRDLRNNSVRSVPVLMSILAVATFLPIVLNDVRFLWDTDDLAGYLSAAVLLVSICPLCALLGYLTPSLIDEDALGDPGAAGKAYAVNILGCILGPLFASYILLPWMGERYGLIVLGLPFLGFYLFASQSLPAWSRFGTGLTAGLLLIWSLFYSVDFGGFISRIIKNTETRRDYAATVVSAGQGFDKHLFVNGVGMTALSPITKVMVHLPLALHTGKSESALIICFGMGTTYRSALSWDVETTAVELVPSVKEAFGFYHADAPHVLRNPKGHILIDDGRRYLMRTREKFDVIVIDPPPPVEATGSSLLYSEEFYELAKQHLKHDGILQAWFPGGNFITAQAILRSLQACFPHVRCFAALMGEGTHMLASMEPIKTLTPEQLADAMPIAAANDLLEWSSSQDLPAYLGQILSRERPLEKTLPSDPKIRVTDDHPYNEYFLLRQWGFF
jgi:spermidine synthase